MKVINKYRCYGKVLKEEPLQLVTNHLLTGSERKGKWYQGDTRREVSRVKCGCGLKQRAYG